MMNQVFNRLPDDRPVRDMCVVEDPDKCPKGYYPVSKTYDQDSDADLWRESGFFGRKCTRYLCLSKTEGSQDYVVQNLAIVNEKDSPPQGYKCILKTVDTEQKAWRKKQLCWKLAPTSSCQTAITDVIVLSRMKKAPGEFSLSGDINGVTLCYKQGNIYNNNKSVYPQIPYPVLPFNSGNPNDSPEKASSYPAKSSEGMENGDKSSGPGNYRHLLPYRPAPKPPTSSYATISGCNGLEGVPFILNPKFNFSNNPMKDFPFPKPKTRSQIDEEYSYEFRTERET